MKRLIILLCFAILTGCGGGGGSSSSQITAKAAISAPSTNTMPGTVSVTVPYTTIATDTTKITSLSTYNMLSSITSNSECDIESINISYPTSFNGTHALPDVKNAPLNTNVQTAIGVMDILPDKSLPAVCDNPVNVQEFQRTVTRLKELNANYVNIIQWHYGQVNSDGTISITENTGGALSDSDLVSYINIAHAAGLKVMISNQIQGYIDINTGSCCLQNPPPDNAQTYNLWLIAYQQFMLNRALLFQSAGVDLWEMGCNGCNYHDVGDNSDNSVQQFKTAYESIITQVANIFKGKKFIYASTVATGSQIILNNVDYLSTGIWTTNTYTTADEANITVSKLVLDYNSQINLLQQYNKPLLLDIGYIESRSNVLSTPGFMNTTGCDSMIGLTVYSTNCVQKTLTTDFNLQAIILEAQLEYLKTQNLPNNSIVKVNSYWQTDYMNQDTLGPTFPNISESIRNKPTEYIVKQWFNH